ncbi:uncharacterized protein LOC125206983 [Salvia hispanica]|uniref:uncharacterized protein LOC125206983 n=1 Tax=Salvia hispanica TaxID=49212 RepID=UPI00200966A8|nr:uncharacterized protein LOC125206983 [Salvia hispanica]
MRCSIRSCKYYLHLECFQLPPQLSSLPLIHQHDHSLVLRSGDILKPWQWQRCSICNINTNGLYYACVKCKIFNVDIKCASMPDTIYHAAHPSHPLNLLPSSQYFESCDACNDSLILFGGKSYACGTCDFMVHLRCAGLPASTTSRRWDKHHPLLLTHDATLNRPGDFYCDQCETKMNPKSWMYHCRACDVSFHPKCFSTTSGRFRNIKFGQKYEIVGAHCHALTYQILTTKRYCNFCGENKHEDHGFLLCIMHVLPLFQPLRL